MFWNKPQNVDKTLQKRIEELENRTTKLESDFLAVLLDQKVLRDKVLRKIQFKREPETEQEEEKPKDLYNGMLIRV